MAFEYCDLFVCPKNKVSLNITPKTLDFSGKLSAFHYDADFLFLSSRFSARGFRQFAIQLQVINWRNKNSIFIFHSQLLTGLIVYRYLFTNDITKMQQFELLLIPVRDHSSSQKIIKTPRTRRPASPRLRCMELRRSLPDPASRRGSF